MCKVVLLNKYFNFSFLVFLIYSVSIIGQDDQSTKTKYDVFSFDKKVILPGTPETIFDAVTGDISGWWDHSFSDNPKEFFIEPVPGGGFWEIFDEKERFLSFEG